MGSVYGPNMVTDGLIMMLDAGNVNSYPGSGTTWYDLVSSNYGSMSLGPTFSSANGGIIDFDGSDDSVHMNEGVYSASAMTIAAWINMDVVPASQTHGYPCILSKRDVGTGRSYFLAFQKSISKLYWEIKNSSGAYFIMYSTKTNWTASTWYYVVTSYHASSGIAKMYIDGVEDAGTFSPAQPWSLDPIPTTTSNTVVGATHASYYEFNGKIALVSFYSDILTAAEVLQNYNAHKSRFGL